MSARTQASSVTRTTVEKALRDAKNGAVYDLIDPGCKGLCMRVAGGSVLWTQRARFAGKNRRWTIGRAIPEPPRGCLPEVREMWAAQHVSVDEARRRGHRIRDMVENGADPTLKAKEWMTGVSVARQLSALEAAGPRSLPWKDAKAMFLHFIKAARRPATWDDYTAILDNTPELAVLEGRMVAGITDLHIAEIIAKIHARKEPHSEHVLRVLSSMWTHLARPEHRNRTGVTPMMLRGVKAPDRTRSESGEDGHEEDDKPPTLLELGRTLAVAKLGALGVAPSAAVMLLLGSAQRRRPVASARYQDFKPFAPEVLWSMPPYFRKTANKKRSKGRHHVPLVGFAAEAAGILHDLTAETGSDWYLPVSRSRHKGTAPKTPHSPPDYINKLLAAIPGGVKSGHPVRAALASYGPEHLGWGQHDSKLILDHLEGFDPGDVTAQHYNTDPQILKKRQMMKAWTDWLDKLAAEAIAADPLLKDREAMREVIYRRRYGDDAWQAAIRNARGLPLPWSDAAITVKTERSAKRRKERAQLAAFAVAAE
jgi:hypothetical protein